LLTACNDVIVEILDLEQVADANESKNKKVDDEKFHDPKLEFLRISVLFYCSEMDVLDRLMFISYFG
jgi:hypothetical protein